MTGRAETVAYLRWLADQPDGIPHRQVLFRAALLITRDHDTVFTSQQLPGARRTGEPIQERHGDHTV